MSPQFSQRKTLSGYRGSGVGSLARWRDRNEFARGSRPKSRPSLSPVLPQALHADCFERTIINVGPFHKVKSFEVRSLGKTPTSSIGKIDQTIRLAFSIVY